MASSIRRSFGIFFCSLLLLLTAGCHLRNDDTVANAPEGAAAIERVVVVPFRQVPPEEPAGNSASCPLCGTIVQAQRFVGAPEQALERLFLTELEKRKPAFAFMSGERVAGVLTRVEASSLKARLREALRETGRELGADAVISGYLYRFRERRGTAYAVEQPASVTFELHLLRVSDGALLWRGYFDKTQSSLLEDLFQLGTFVRGKGRWMTAEELLAEGIGEVLPSLPGLRAAETAPEAAPGR